MEGLTLQHQHGKARVRVARLWRLRGGEHRLVEWNVSISITSHVLPAFTDGDNSNIVATDSIKNTVLIIRNRTIVPGAFVVFFFFFLSGILLFAGVCFGEGVQAGAFVGGFRGDCGAALCSHLSQGNDWGFRLFDFCKTFFSCVILFLSVTRLLLVPRLFFPRSHGSEFPWTAPSTTTVMSSPDSLLRKRIEEHTYRLFSERNAPISRFNVALLVDRFQARLWKAHSRGHSWQRWPRQGDLRISRLGFTQNNSGTHNSDLESVHLQFEILAVLQSCLQMTLKLSISCRRSSSLLYLFTENSISSFLP